MTEITIKDGIIYVGRVTIVFESDGKYDQDTIDAEAMRLNKFFREHISSGMYEKLAKLMSEK